MSNHLKAFKIKRIRLGIAVKGEEDATYAGGRLSQKQVAPHIRRATAGNKLSLKMAFH
jgi:hypothetical protein